MWNLKNGEAVFSSGDFVVHLPTTEFPSGIDLSWQGNAMGRLFETVSQAGPWGELVESYVRNHDLVLSYAERSSDQVRTQVYWRHCQAADQSLGGVEFWVSVETARLNSVPSLTIESRLPGQEFWSWTGAGDWASNSGQQACCVLVRSAAAPISILLASHPADPRMSLSHHAGCLLVQSSLFGEPLEKGVLRRCRVSAWCLPLQNDISRAEGLFERFRVAPPPLTA